MARLRLLLTSGVRLGIPVVDQGVTSVTNLGISIGVASSSSASVFGEFALLYSIYWTATGFTRATVGETAMGSAQHAPRSSFAQPLALAVVIGLFACAVSLLLGVLLGSLVLRLGSVCIWVLVLQDCYRYICFTMGRPVGALLSDLVMLALVVAPASIRLFGLPSASIQVWIGAWALGALAGVACAAIMTRTVPQGRGMRRWLTSNSGLVRNVGAEFWLDTGALQLLTFLMPLASSLSQLGGLKAAQLAVGPLNVVVAALGLTVLPRMFASNQHPDAGSRKRRLVLLSCSLMTVVSAIYALTLVLLPSAILRGAFGSAGSELFPTVLLVTAQTASAGALQSAAYALRASGRARTNLMLRAVFTPFSIVIPLYGAYRAGALGAATGLLSVALLACAVRLFAAARLAYLGDHKPALSGVLASDERPR